jgi:hypothetical protein
MTPFGIECGHCIFRDAEVEITLAAGEVYYACKGCAGRVIAEKASTENPVHEMHELEPDPYWDGHTAYEG